MYVVRSTIGFLLIAASCVALMTRGTIGFTLGRALTVTQTAVLMLFIGVILVMSGHSRVRN